mgnify:CR=1 FL=1
MRNTLTPLKRFHRLAEAAAFLGVLCTVASLLDRNVWFLEYGTHFKPQLAACFLLYAGLEWAMRRHCHALASLAVAAVNALPVLLLVLPVSGAKGHTPAQSSAHVRILQANILTCNTNAPALVALIAKEAPDVVVLQEPDAWWLRQLAPLTNSYPVSATLPRDDNFGSAIYCKSNALSADIFRLNDPEGAPCSHARIAVGGKTLTVVGTHTLAPYTEAMWKGRNSFTLGLAKTLRKVNGPLVVTGDFNNTPWSSHFHEFLKTSGLLDSDQGRGFQPTWPASAFPLARLPLDHCFHSGDVRILSKRLGPDIGSDHLPLIIDVAF